MVEREPSSIVPCGENLHWRRISTFAFVPVDALDVDRLFEAVPVRSDSEGSLRAEWLLADTHEAECHSHVYLRVVRESGESRNSGDDSGESSQQFYSFELLTVRTPVELHEADTSIRHSDFLQRLAAATSSDEVLIGTTVDLYYDTAEVRWRVSLLTESQKFAEFDEDLGTIALSGLTLRFENSSVGLTRVGLDTSPYGDEYRISLSFSTTIERSRLEFMFSDILARAEEFSSLFVHLKAKAHSA
jgi:hypothetical protein